LITLLLAGLCVAAPTPSQPAGTEPPRTFRLDPQVLQQTKRRVLAREASLEPALVRLRAEAGKALTAGLFSVVTKAAVPPSGDRPTP
jgi:hypothetical protein